MGFTQYPCPACFQQQSLTHQNGERVESRLCPSCEEEAAKLSLKAEQFIKKAHELRRKAADAQL